MQGRRPRDARDAADAWKTTFSSESPEDAEARRDAKRSLTTKRLGDGMGELRAVLPLIDLRQVTNAVGSTDLSNLGLWCRHHHELKHSPGVKVMGDANNLRLQLADGTIINCPPKRRTRPRQQAAA